MTETVEVNRDQLIETVGRLWALGDLLVQLNGGSETPLTEEVQQIAYKLANLTAGGDYPPDPHELNAEGWEETSRPDYVAIRLAAAHQLGEDLQQYADGFAELAASERENAKAILRTGKALA